MARLVSAPANIGNWARTPSPSLASCSRNTSRRAIRLRRASALTQNPHWPSYTMSITPIVSNTMLTRPCGAGQGRAGAEPEPEEPADYAQDEQLGEDNHGNADGQLLGHAETAKEKVMKLLAEADPVNRNRDVREDRDRQQHEQNRLVRNNDRVSHPEVGLVDPAERQEIHERDREDCQDDPRTSPQRAAALPDEFERLRHAPQQGHAAKEGDDRREPEGQRGGQAGDQDHAENRQYLARYDERGRRDVEPPDESAPPRGRRKETQAPVHEDRGGDGRVPFLTTQVIDARGLCLCPGAGRGLSSGTTNQRCRRWTEG